MKHNWPIWRRTYLGMFGSPERALDMLTTGHARTPTLFHPWTKEAIEKINFAQEERIVEIVLVTNRHLGLLIATHGQVFEAAQDRDLRPLPSEAAVALRYQYLEQPLGETIWCRTSPLDIELGWADQVRFFLHRDPFGNWIDVYKTPDDDGIMIEDAACPPDTLWAFQAPE